MPCFSCREVSIAKMACCISLNLVAFILPLTAKWSNFANYHYLVSFKNKIILLRFFYTKPLLSTSYVYILDDARNNDEISPHWKTSLRLKIIITGTLFNGFEKLRYKNLSLLLYIQKCKYI